MKSFEEAIKAAGMEHIKIRRIQTYSIMDSRSAVLRIRKRKSRSMNWETIFEGMNTVEVLHRVVIHGVSKHDANFKKDKSEDIIAQIPEHRFKKDNRKEN